VPLATLVAALAQLVPVHDAAPAAIVGTVQSFAVHAPVAAKVPAVHNPGLVQV